MVKVKPIVCLQDVNIKLYSHDVIPKVPSNMNFRLPSLCELDPFLNILHSLRVVVVVVVVNLYLTRVIPSEYLKVYLELFVGIKVNDLV